MKKKLVSLLLTLILLLSLIPSASAASGDRQRHADALATLGIVQVNDSDYRLTTPASRAHVAVLLSRLSDQQPAYIAGKFTDVPAWCKTEVEFAAAQGWINGTSSTAFSPNLTISANAWCAMLLRMLGYQDGKGDFTISEAASFAYHIGLTSQKYSGLLTRGDVFDILYDALTFSYKDSSERVIDRLISSGKTSMAAANALGLLSKDLTARQVADRFSSAVVCLDRYTPEDDVDAKAPSGNASAFFVSPDGLAITNYHSIEGGVVVHGKTINGDVFPVERVIYYDAGIDCALVKFSKTALSGKTVSAFSYLDVVGTEEMCAGDPVYTLSNPLGLGLAISTGIISATARDVERYTLPCIMSTADISQGSSGGALMNTRGQVIGITSGAFVYGNSMYLAVPADPVMKADWTAKGYTLEEVLDIESAKES